MRADRLLSAAMHGHQRLDCLRQVLIQELLAVYEYGVKDERRAADLQARKERKKVPQTKRQAEVLEYFRSFQERRGYVPSYSQVCRHFGFTSKATVAAHVSALRRQGFPIAVRGASK